MTLLPTPTDPGDRMADVELLYRSALEATRAALGARHPGTLGAMADMANVLQDQGKLDKAAP